MVRLTDRPDMTLDVYRGRKTTIQYVPVLMHFRVYRAVTVDTIFFNSAGVNFMFFFFFFFFGVLRAYIDCVVIHGTYSAASISQLRTFSYS